MKWPISVAPYDVVIMPMISKNDNVNFDKSVKIYNELKKNNIDVLLDDTNENLSSKMKKSDLIGIPFQIIIGKKTESEFIEFKQVGKDSEKINLNKIIEKINKEKNSI